MSCFYNNKCYNCCNFVKSTSVAIVDSVLQITIPTFTYANDAHVCICIAQDIPTGATADIPVAIIDGTNTYSLRKKNGNTVYADSIKSRTMLCTSFAIDNAVFVVWNCKALAKSAHVYVAPTTEVTP